MPKVGSVQTYEPNQVSRKPLPGVRVSPNAPDEAFNVGASAQRLNAQTQQSLRQIQAVNDAYVKQADETIANQRDTIAAAAENKLRQDLKGMAGSKAFGAKDQIDAEWSKVQAEALKDLTPNQRAIVSPRLRARYDSLDQSVNLHMGAEIPKYQVGILDTSYKTAQEKAIQNYSNPQLVGESIVVQRNAIQQKAKILGYSPEQEAAEVVAMESQTNAGIINAMLADGKNEMANQQFKDTHNLILPEDRKPLQERIGKLILADQGEAKAIEILNTAKDDADAAAKAAKIEDESLRKETERQLETQIRVRNETYNKNESSIVDKYVNGNYSEAQFNAEKNFASPGFRSLFENSFFVNNASSNKARTYVQLQKDYADIYTGSVEERNDKLLKFRQAVISNKGLLTSKDYRKLLSFSTDNHITTNDDAGKANYIHGGLSWIDKVFGDHATKSQAGDIFLKKIHSAKEKEQVQNAAMEAIFQQQASSDPSSLGFVVGQEYTNPHGVVARAVRKEDGTIDLVLSRKKK